MNVTPAQTEIEVDLARVRRLAKMLDAQFEIGGIKVGWDAIVGLIPVAGDIVTGALGLYPLLLARKHALGGSAGSDFHEPGLPWRPLGRFAKLPDGIEPLWARLRAGPTLEGSSGRHV